jgi:hypothetical protein
MGSHACSHAQPHLAEGSRSNASRRTSLKASLKKDGDSSSGWGCVSAAEEKKPPSPPRVITTRRMGAAWIRAAMTLCEGAAHRKDICMVMNGTGANTGCDSWGLVLHRWGRERATTSQRGSHIHTRALVASTSSTPPPLHLKGVASTNSCGAIGGANQQLAHFAAL